ncbi:MAG: hypothetical protein LBE83_01155 [Propionibacteriaceae bacterium]|jgi:tight adherence protein B|nr:hypothetical protein [Propionibacteriaceae bacterium]
MTAVAVIAAGLAIWFLVPPRSFGLTRLARRSKVVARVNYWRLAGGVVACGVVLGLFWPLFAILAVLGLVGLTIAWVVMIRARERRALRQMKEVVRLAQILESLLALGHIPAVALALAAEESPIAAPVASAGRLGGDAWEVLEYLAKEPGQAGLAQIGRAWKVSQQAGASMHEALMEVRESLHQTSETATVVTGELSGPRATGQMLAILPLVGLGLALGIGADPLGFLLGSLIGRICLILGFALGCAGVVWSEILARRVGGAV